MSKFFNVYLQKASSSEAQAWFSSPAGVTSVTYTDAINFKIDWRLSAEDNVLRTSKWMNIFVFFPAVLKKPHRKCVCRRLSLFARECSVCLYFEGTKFLHISSKPKRRSSVREANHIET